MTINSWKGEQQQQQQKQALEAWAFRSLALKNLGYDLSFEGSNIFVGKLEVSFWALWKEKNPFFPWSCDPLILSKMGEICNLTKNDHVRGA